MHTNLLTRRLALSSASLLSSDQIKLDQVLNTFTSSVSDWKSLASMSFASLSYGFTKAATARFLPGILPNGVALFSEVACFRTSSSLLNGGSLAAAFEEKAFLSTALDFTLLKGTGKLFQGTNPILSHTIQSGSMVLGNELASSFHWIEREKGSLADRWIQAEVKNAQMIAGMSLGASLTGHYFQIKEISLEAQAQSIEKGSLINRSFQFYESSPVEFMNGDLSFDPLTLSAANFLQKIRVGEIQAKRGRKEVNDAAQKAAKLFLASALEVFGLPEGNAPTFLKVVSGIWADISRGNVSESRSEDMGRESAEILDASLKLARSAQMPPSLLNISLHTLDIQAFVTSRGWLLREIERIRDRAQSSQDFIQLQTALLLEKNEKTLMARAIQEKDPEYFRRAAEALPAMLQTLYELIQIMRKSSDPDVLEAADLLGGDWGSEQKGKSKRKGNVNSIVGNAFGSGNLQKNVVEVRKNFENAEMLKELNEDIERLKSEGEADVAEALQKNKGSIICQALAYGKWTYPKEAVRAFEGPSGFVATLEREIIAMQGVVEDKVIQTLRKNKPSIISYALAQGNLIYAREVVAKFAGEHGFVRKYSRLLKDLEDKASEAAFLLTLRTKEDRIFHQALYRDSFGPETDREFYNWMKMKIKAWLSERGDEEGES